MIHRALLAAALALLPLCADAQDISGVRQTRQLAFSSSTVGNGADTTEDTLKTYTVAAGQLANVGDRLRVVASGSFAATTDNKTIRIRLGATQFATTGTASAASTVWRMEVDIVKTGSNTQASSSLSMISNVTTAAALLSNATGTLTDTGALTLTVTGQDNTAATANAIDCRFFMVEFIPAVS